MRLLILFLLAITSSFAQISFDPIFIDNNSSTADAANTVTTGDFDGDGDIDVVGGAFLSDIFSLYTNDGNGNFTQSTIDNGPNADGARFVTSFDLDQDGDLDILACSSNANLSLWYENDGNANFTGNVIDNTLISDNAYAIDAGDLNNDGHADVVVGAFGGDSVVWLANDGSENFTLGGVLDNTTDLSNGVRKVQIVDLDQDGDLDVVVAGFVVGVYSWFVNDGNGSFTSQIIDNSPDAFGATAFDVADLDGDGDLDLAAGSNNANQFLWYENDGNQNFTGIIIDNTTNYSIGPRGLTTSDIDQDGDVDIITAAITGDSYAWYENDGDGNFSGELISDDPTYANGAFAVVTADVDGDLVEDIVASSNISDAFLYFKTEGVLSTPAFENPVFAVYPNPVLDQLTILTSASGTMAILSDNLGRVIWERAVDLQESTIETSDLTAGIYYLELSGQGQIQTFKIIKE